MIKTPSYISAIKPYVPGKPVEELERELGITNSIKLASNENPLGPSPMALQAILDDLSNTAHPNSINRYPDGSGYYLKKALSGRLSVSEEQIILGNIRGSPFARGDQPEVGLRQPAPQPDHHQPDHDRHHEQ